MDDRRLVTVSKFLSKYLRHEPETLGLTLEPGGWVPVDALFAGAAGRGFRISRDELDQVVAQNDKRRFSFDPTGTRIRANQGHSTTVDLQLAPVPPDEVPDVLYHGTVSRFLEEILREGLRPMQRHHVHLSPDVETASKVGMRRGPPVVLVVAARALSQSGVVFYRSDNGVWLVEAVPPAYLRTEASGATQGTEGKIDGSHTRPSSRKPDFKTFLLAGPDLSALDLERARDMPRDISLNS